jgi:cytochrome c-type biogenesis protein CcmH
MELYPFVDPKQQALFQKIIQHVRCDTCPNQRLSDSTTPAAIKLRAHIYEEILANRSEQAIFKALSQQQGTFILYNPPENVGTVFLWFGPCLFLAGLLFFSENY